MGHQKKFSKWFLGYKMEIFVGLSKVNVAGFSKVNDCFCLSEVNEN
jgi:hypothetical protein